MKNKEGWNEIERWAENEKLKKMQKYRIDIDNISMNEKTKGVRKIITFMNFSGKTIKIIIMILSIIIAIAVCDMIRTSMKNINRDLKETLELGYNVKLELISKETDEKGNGKYIFVTEENRNIPFTAINSNKHFTDDLYDSYHKYYFEKWNSPNKKYFTVNSKIENKLLEYETYIEINAYDDIESAMKIMYEFVEYVGNDFCISWNIYVKKGALRIYPDKSIEEAKKIYLENTK